MSNGNFATDGALIEGAIAGHNDCFSLLMNRHVTALKRQLRSMISNDADLEDTLQDVLLNVGRQ